MKSIRCLLVMWVCLAFSSPLQAEVLRVIVESRTAFSEDVEGKIGPYERIRGRVVYALDPDLEANGAVVDLHLGLRMAMVMSSFMRILKLSHPLIAPWPNTQCCTT